MKKTITEERIIFDIIDLSKEKTETMLLLNNLLHSRTQRLSRRFDKMKDQVFND